MSTKPTQGRNLTGPARHVRDLAADVHASVQQWNAAHLRGLTLLRNITEEKQNESYSQSLQEQCDKLEYVCDELVKRCFKCIVSYFREIRFEENLFTGRDRKASRSSCTPTESSRISGETRGQIVYNVAHGKIWCV